MSGLPELRPLSLSEVLDRGFKIAVRNYGRLLAIASVVFLPIFVLACLIVKAKMPDASAVVDGQIVFLTQEDIDAFELAVGGAALLGFLGYLIAIAAMHFAVGDVYLDETRTVGESVRMTGRRVGQILLVLVGTVIGVAVPLVVAVIVFAAVSQALGILAFIAAGVFGYWFFVASSLALAVVMREQVNGLDAIRRSIELVKGKWLTTFGLYIVTGILLGVLSFVVSSIMAKVFAGGAGDSVTGVAIASVAAPFVGELITAPILVAIVTVFYFDLRVRKEGYDLEMLARESGIAFDAGPGMVAQPARGPRLDMPAMAPASSPQAPSAAPAPPPLPPLAPPPPGDNPPGVRGPRWSEPLGPG